MNTFPAKVLAVFFTLSLLIFLSAPTMAQDQNQEIVDPDVNPLIQEFLPEGVTLDTATDEQFIAAVSAAVSAYPDQASSITGFAVQSKPALAASITSAAIQAAPEQAEAIVNAALQSAPDQAESIVSAAIETAPPGTLPPAHVILPRTPAAFVTLPTLPDQASPPARDERPPSPVRP